MLPSVNVNVYFLYRFMLPTKVSYASLSTASYRICNESGKTMSIDMTSSTSASSNACEHSALVLLLKKMATKTSNVLGGMIDLPWDGGEIVKSMEDVRIVEDMLDHENEAGLFSEMVLPHLFPMLKALLPPMDGQDKSSPIKNKVGADKLETTSANIVSSIAEDKPTYDGLVLSTSDVIERLDFVITQMDIARIERTASHCLHVENIHQLPTIKYRKSNSDRSDVLICPPCDHVLGHEIEDKKQSHQGQVHDDTQVWSWMMIPRDTSKEVSRIISTNWSDIPESISICSSHNDDDMDPSFDYCVICRAHFREGEMLLTLVRRGAVIACFYIFSRRNTH